MKSYKIIEGIIMGLIIGSVVALCSLFHLKQASAFDTIGWNYGGYYTNGGYDPCPVGTSCIFNSPIKATSITTNTITATTYYNLPQSIAGSASYITSGTGVYETATSTGLNVLGGLTVDDLTGTTITAVTLLISPYIEGMNITATNGSFQYNLSASTITANNNLSASTITAYNNLSASTITSMIYNTNDGTSIIPQGYDSTLINGVTTVTMSIGCTNTLYHVSANYDEPTAGSVFGILNIVKATGTTFTITSYTVAGAINTTDNGNIEGIVTCQ